MQGPSVCSNGDAPYCEGMTKPACSTGFEMDYSKDPPKCSDGNAPACKDGALPMTCADGGTTTNTESKITL